MQSICSLKYTKACRCLTLAYHEGTDTSLHPYVEESCRRRGELAVLRHIFSA